MDILLFKMEEADNRSLDNPQEYILDKGSQIFVALLNDEVVGVCALMVMHDGEHNFDLAKMAVSPSAQGKSIGWLLRARCIKKGGFTRCCKGIFGKQYNT